MPKSEHSYKGGRYRPENAQEKGQRGTCVTCGKAKSQHTKF